MTRSVPGTRRRLAAIFCADVAGYTRLMNADERGTLRLLTSRREVTDRQIERHGGRIANTAGDSILAEFPSAVDAVRCALAIHELVAAANQEVPEERRIAFRIGVHVGEAMVRNGDLFGDGVNIAARLQSLAQPGSVCLSSAAHEYVHRVLPLTFEDLGPQSVKNLDTPVRAYLTRPTSEPLPRALPPSHRHNEFYLARRFQALCSAALAKVAHQVDLRELDCPVLATIAEAPGLSPREVADLAGIDPGTVERSVKRLERRELLTVTPRSGGPSRSLNLTPAGLQIRMWIRAQFLAAQDRMMTPLSDQERETLKNLLTRVIRAGMVEASNP